ncbi:uncharacterized protein WM277_016354 isoform 1-T1 [Molossus nigricans]
METMELNSPASEQVRMTQRSLDQWSSPSEEAAGGMGGRGAGAIQQPRVATTRERGRDRERKRETSMKEDINQLPAAFPSLGIWPTMWPDWELNWQPRGAWVDAQLLSHTIQICDAIALHTFPVAAITHIKFQDGRQGAP